MYRLLWTLGNTFSLYIGCSDWHHEVFTAHKKTCLCFPGIHCPLISKFSAGHVTPPPPLKYPPPCNLRPPGEGGGSLHCFARQYLLQWFVFPICHTHVLALLSHYFQSVTCVYSVMFSLQRRCTRCCPFFKPKMFSPGDRVWYHSRTRGTHVLATVVGPSPNGPQFCHIRYICPGGVTPVDLLFTAGKQGFYAVLLLLYTVSI